MIDTQLTQTVRISCDHCGIVAGEWRPTVPEARTLAQAEGFRFSVWMDGGCARELCLCPACYLKTNE